MRLPWLAAGLVLASAGPAFAQDQPLPAAWRFSQSADDTYAAGVTDDDSHGGRWCAFLKAGLRHPKGFATVSQTVGAARYRGKRLRYSAWLKGAGVAGEGSLWVRIDGADHALLAYDNAAGQRVHGTSGWKRCAVELEVPAGSVDVAFGFMLAGDGVLCFDDARLEAVSSKQPGATPGLGFER